MFSIDHFNFHYFISENGVQWARIFWWFPRGRPGRWSRRQSRRLQPVLTTARRLPRLQSNEQPVWQYERKCASVQPKRPAIQPERTKLQPTKLQPLSTTKLQ